MFVKQFLRALPLWCLLLLTLLGGCGGSQQYVTLASDGASYGGAVAALSERASAVRVESSSYALLQQRGELTKKYKGTALKKATGNSLRQTTQSDLGAIESNLKTREVALFLRDYFIVLQELAASTAPVNIGAKTGEIIEKLDGAMSAKKVPSFPLPPSIAPGIVSHVTDGVLRKELNGRKKSILSALDILEKLLGTLGREIDGQTKSIRNARVALLIQPAFQDTTLASLSSLSDKELWVTLRQKEVLGSIAEKDDREAIASAITSGSKFRKFFVKVTGE
jgi:hypothetical protein